MVHIGAPAEREHVKIHLLIEALPRTNSTLTTGRTTKSYEPILFFLYFQDDLRRKVTNIIQVLNQTKNCHSIDARVKYLNDTDEKANWVYVYFFLLALVTEPKLLQVFLHRLLSYTELKKCGVSKGLTADPSLERISGLEGVLVRRTNTCSNSRLSSLPE